VLVSLWRQRCYTGSSTPCTPDPPGTTNRLQAGTLSQAQSPSDGTKQTPGPWFPKLATMGESQAPAPWDGPDHWMGSPRFDPLDWPPRVSRRVVAGSGGNMEV